MNDLTCAANGVNCEIATKQTGQCITCSPGYFQIPGDFMDCNGNVPNCLKAVRIGTTNTANC